MVLTTDDFVWPVERYLSTVAEARVDPFLSKEYLSSWRKPTPNCEKENRKAQDWYDEMKLGNVWQCPIIMKVFKDGECLVNHDAAAWGLPKGTFVCLHGCSRRAALLLFAKVKEVLAELDHYDGKIIWISSEMSWGFCGGKRIPTGCLPTLTAKTEMVLLSLNPDFGFQLRFLSVREMFRFHGVCLEDIVAPGEVNALTYHYSMPQLVRMVGNSFHHPSMSAMAFGTVLR